MTLYSSEMRDDYITWSIADGFLPWWKVEIKMDMAWTWFILTLNWSCNILALSSHMLPRVSFLFSEACRLRYEKIHKDTMIHIRTHVNKSFLHHVFPTFLDQNFWYQWWGILPLFPNIFSHNLIHIFPPSLSKPALVSMTPPLMNQFTGITDIIQQHSIKRRCPTFRPNPNTWRKLIHNSVQHRLQETFTRRSGSDFF